MLLPSTLYQNQTLTMGNQITSNNSLYFAIVQTDGNFVVYDVSIWFWFLSFKRQMISNLSFLI